MLSTSSRKWFEAAATLAWTGNYGAPGAMPKKIVNRFLRTVPSITKSFHDTLHAVDTGGQIILLRRKFLPVWTHFIKLDWPDYITKPAV